MHTFSPALVDGPTPCSSPAGPQLDLFGLRVAPANPSAPPDNDAGKPMTGTSGPPSSGSSASAALAQSLGSRLQARLGTAGSMEYRQTWKQKATPLGRSYWAHIASGRPISASGCTGWPSPAASEPGGTPEQHLARKRAQVAKGVSMGSNAVTALSLLVQLAGWLTPKCPSGGGQETRQTPGGGLRKLEDQVYLTGWTSPRQSDGKTGHHYSERMTGKSLTMDASLTPGAILPSCPAATAKPGALNPAFALWLMGFPSAWLMAAPVKASRAQPSSKG